jgi:hypothetical protein
MSMDVRILGGIYIVLCGALIPIGAALGIYGLCVLWKRDASAGSPWLALPASRQISLLLATASVGAGFFIVLKIGFLVHHDPQPDVIANGAYTAIAVLVLAASAVWGTLRAIESGRDAMVRSRIRKESYRSAAEHIEARRLRAAELAADPARARYAPLVERGEIWTDGHIAYYENPLAFATCVHLRPIELAMRAAGIDLRLYKNLEVTAKCHVDYERLKRLFHAEAPIAYSEFYMGEPQYHERPAAFLICADHQSMIYTVHPDDSGPLFPLPQNPA